jgi:hypothetical protein
MCSIVRNQSELAKWAGDATMPGYLAGRPPRNKGLRYPADPPRVEEIIAVMREAGYALPASREAASAAG